jgi:hypothetical protein
VRFELADSIQCTIVLGEIHYRRAGAGSWTPQHAFVTSVRVPVQSGGTAVLTIVTDKDLPADACTP